jgi:hypothetical protein
VLRAVALAALGAAAFAVLAAPLPGELRGCGGDTSGAVDAGAYCEDKCAVEAEALRRCGLIPDSDIREEEQVQYCVSVRHCEAPVICYGTPDYHISYEEAGACFDAIVLLNCAQVELMSSDPPAPCQEDELCDPE